MVFFIQCKNCMSVEKISLESGKLSVFKVHFILSVAKLYYYCCELARRVSLGCKWPHITTRDRLFAILASEEKKMHSLCLPGKFPWKQSVQSFKNQGTFQQSKIKVSQVQIPSMDFKSQKSPNKNSKIHIVLEENIFEYSKLFFDPWKFFWIVFNCDQFMI